MSRGILDTSVLVDTGLHPLPGELAISVVSIAELQFGVLVAKNPQARAKRLSRLGSIQRRFEPLPVDDVVADSYGQLAAQFASIGRTPRTRSMDLLIAATAHAHGATLYTRNAKDLNGLESLVDIVAL